MVVDIADYDFIANGNMMIFDGWKKIYDYISSEDNLLPNLKKGDKCAWNMTENS